jgi:hypothetical protein
LLDPAVLVPFSIADDQISHDGRGQR